MLPLRDEIAVRRFPIVNYALIALNIVVFLYQLSMGRLADRFIYQYALIPAQVAQGLDLNDFVRVFTSMFMHGGIAHIAGNMLYLWIFGDNVEDAMGHGKYLLFYLMGGVFASLAQVMTNLNSPIPTVGASGAIAAVLGAYLVLYPHSRVLTLVTLGIFIRLSMIPAIVVLGLWFILQLVLGFLSMGASAAGGVAFWAHIGGFLIGLLLVRLFVPRPRYSNQTTWRSF